MSFQLRDTATKIQVCIEGRRCKNIKKGETNGRIREPKKERRTRKEKEGCVVLRIRRIDKKKTHLDSRTWAIPTCELSNENQCEQCPGGD